MIQGAGSLRPLLTQAAQAAAATGSRALLLPMTFNTPAGDQPSEEVGPNQHWAKVLEQLVRLLTGYTPMRFTPFYVLKKHGETEENTPPRWRTILGLEEIQYLPEDVNDPDQNVSLGKTAHEVWHVLFSRPELIFDEPEFIKNMAFQALWWAIEDPRVNIQGTKKHPGAREWIDAAMTKDYAIKDLAAEQERWTKEIPLHLQFNYALIYEWWSGAPDPRVTDDRVKEALAKAADPIRRAYSTGDARKSFKIIRDEVWPIYKELVDESYENEQDKQKGQDGEEGDEQDQQNQDQQDQDSDSSSSSSSQQQGKQGKQGKQDKSQKQKKQQKPVSKKTKEEMEKKEKEFRDKHASKVVDKPEKMSEKEKQDAKKDLERMRKKMGQKQEGDKQEGDPQQGQPQDADSESDGQKNQTAEQKQAQRERLSKPDSREETDSQDEAKYKDYFSKVRHLVPVMKAQFQQVLRRKIRRRFVHDRKSGDLDEESISEIPGGKRDVFEESMVANKNLYRVSLMIDVSGSMSGEKKEHSVLAAVMMMEALDKLPGVAYEIVRFDDSPQVVKSYNERTTQAMKVAVVKALLKNGGSTQSDLALKEAIQRIRMGRGDKLMMMINDGDPDNNFDREAYRKMVLAAKDIEIHGLGLGPEAQLVIDLFPKGRGWWLKDVADCAKRIREILKKKFLGGS